MTITSTGSVSLQDIEDEFGGTGEISLFEYYRGNGYENAVSGNNTGIPQSGPISMLSFRGTSLARYIEYSILGAGGGGGYGVDNGSGSGSAGDGGSSTITVNGTTYTASGGAGGANGAISRLTDHSGENATIANGYSRDFGTSGGNTGNNSNASAGSGYVAGGSGGGGDSPDEYDSSGNAGVGGEAGDEVTGNAWVVVGQSISYSLGSAGSAGAGGYYGAAGLPGYVVIVSNGTDVVTTGTSGSYTVA